jgi:hypothetical protein
VRNEEEDDDGRKRGKRGEYEASEVATLYTQGNLYFYPPQKLNSINNYGFELIYF